jgi:hypothetical protein
MKWETVCRPGFSGKERDKRGKQWDERYGEGNWRIAWVYGAQVIPFKHACLVYEDAYYHDSFKRRDLWTILIQTASDVYDSNVSNVNSGFDYLKQETDSTHLQDIAIRRVIMRRGWDFQGEELVQIRSHDDFWGEMLSPGKVPFHNIPAIKEPPLTGWWDEDTIEDFYQSNKVLQIKEETP